MGTKDLVRDSPAIDGATLHVVNGENRDCSIDVRREPSVVGSGDDCDLVLNDGTVSARHFTVHIDTNGVRVVDLGSTNGTYLRGTRIDSACVSSESTLSVGATELILLTDSPSSPLAPRYGALIGVSPAMQRLYRTLRRVERIEAPVLITGETGSGKGVTARTIHEKSSRRDEPFVVLDCASISAELLESELFGHRVGSFTGAASSRRGVFEAAGRGTVFIDEVGELPRSLQTRLLRVVEDGRFRPVGAELEQRSEARIIAATHRPLDQLAADGSGSPLSGSTDHLEIDLLQPT
ncbi:MAG: sigma-54-dependent Fis family transcriptional regulator, partial [Myxococcota bacterium]